MELIQPKLIIIYAAVKAAAVAAEAAAAAAAASAASAASAAVAAAAAESGICRVSFRQSPNYRLARTLFLFV